MCKCVSVVNGHFEPEDQMVTDPQRNLGTIITNENSHPKMLLKIIEYHVEFGMII